VKNKLYAEYFKLLHKPRTYIGPAAMTLLVAVALVALKYGNQFRYMEERLSQDYILAGSFINAAFLARFMLFEFVVFMFLPLFSSMVFSDLIAGEASDGTLRMMLCRPASRLGIAAAKYAAGVTYVLALTFGVGVLSYAAGWASLGRGSLVSLTGGIWVFPEGQAILRLLLAYGLVGLGMAAVGSIAFAVSAFLSNASGAVAGAVGLVVFSGIIGEIEFFAPLHPFLLTTYMRVGWLFKGGIDAHALLQSAGVMLAYTAVAAAIGFAAFTRRDVLF
jgi:ABC-2 type transport system permease protein